MNISPPRVWLVLGDKPGDNAQVQIVADALGVPCELRRVIPRSEWILGKPRVHASIEHLDPARSDALEPPWPDLVLTIGRRPSMAALWIQEQSGGRSRIAIFGPPKRWPERFALVVAPAQYRFGPMPQLVPIRFPLMRNKSSEIEAARTLWAERMSALARPITALLIGGQTKPYRLDAAFARALVRRSLALSEGGTLYVTTSRRTLPEAVEAIRTELPPNARFFRWSADASDNPYLALLALADRFVVTGDSISMMVEVARQGRPLAIAALPYRNAWSRALHRFANAGRDTGGGLTATVAGALRRAGLLRGARDLSAMHQVLYEEGLAQPLERGFSRGGRALPDELPVVVARIRELLEHTAEPQPEHS
jgi:mitochondrial fission protein ELM1